MCHRRTLSCTPVSLMFGLFLVLRSPWSRPCYTLRRDISPVTAPWSLIRSSSFFSRNESLPTPPWFHGLRVTTSSQREICIPVAQIGGKHLLSHILNSQSKIYKHQSPPICSLVVSEKQPPSPHILGTLST